MTTIKYEVVLTDKTNGEKRSEFVSLSDAEIADAMWHLEERGPKGPGGPEGPIARGYALRHALRQAPRRFSQDPETSAFIHIIKH